MASYNVHGLRDDRAALRRVIRAIEPDVLLVQEAPRLLWADRRTKRFARTVGMEWPGGRRGRASTTAYVARNVGVAEWTHHLLHVRRGDEPRGYAVLGLDLAGVGRVRIGSVHLSLRAEERPDQIAHVIETLGPTRAVLGGDLNEAPGGPVWTAIREGFGKAASTSAPTFPAARPRTRIDAVFTTPDLVAVPVQLDLGASELRRASDHLPVVVDIVAERTGGE